MQIALITSITVLAALGIIVGVMIFAGFLTFKRFVGRQKKEANMADIRFVPQLGETYNDYVAFTKDKQNYINTLEKKEYIIDGIDGIKLKGFYFPAKEDSKVTIICSHGHKSTCFNDFAGILPFFNHKNYNVLFTVSRAHLGSEGKYMTLGKKESKDLVRWTEFIDDQNPGQNIFIYGASLGAVNAMILTGLDYIPSSIKGVVSDSGYSRAYDFLLYQMRHEYKLSPYPTIPIANWFAKRIAKVNFKKPSPIESVKESTLPILFIHGNKDQFVPTYMGDACYRACSSPKKLLTIDNASHMQAYFINPEKYEEAFADFVSEYSTK